jgi:aryl-alcohol dehydrogenase-like predicted oxidoreductase
MRYTLLGKTGVRVSELALGTMTFGEERGWGASIGQRGHFRPVRQGGRQLR